MPEAMMSYDEFVTHNNHIDNLATLWLKDRIKYREVDELWCAIGDGFAEVLWDVGATQEPFNEAPSSSWGWLLPATTATRRLWTTQSSTMIWSAKATGLTTKNESLTAEA